MRPVLRPQEPYQYVQRADVDGTCPECGGNEIKAYPVLSEGGWWKVKKCQHCLNSLERKRWGLFGSMTTLTETL